MQASKTELSLVIDKGNSRTKLGIFKGNQLIKQVAVESFTITFLKELFDKYPNIKYSIMANVAQPMPAIAQFLNSHTRHVALNEHTALPFKNKYQTTQTLGQDRIAIAAAAQILNPQKPTLIVNCGTCITYDFITAQNHYLGGSISPGINMRLQALAHFTQKLPLIKLDIPKLLIGNTTQTAIVTGVVHGVIDEICGKQTRYQKKYNHLQTYLTGGDALFLAKQIKNEIFATPHLTLIGLNEIIKYTYIK